jgi:hypothetical protein
VKLPPDIVAKLPPGRGVNFAALSPGAGEAEFQAAVMALAESRGWLVYSVPDSRRATAAGFPDLVLTRRRVVIAAELKRDGWRPRPEQRAWLDAFAACGVPAHHWTPAAWAEIEAALA